MCRHLGAWLDFFSGQTCGPVSVPPVVTPIDAYVRIPLYILRSVLRDPAVNFR